MAYFLGRDVKVAICCEDASNGINIDASGTPDTIASGTTATGDVVDHLWADSNAPFDGNSAYNPFTDVTSVDLTLGKVDEDVAYMGQRTALKAEIKNETTLVITKKKTTKFWDLTYMKARHGVGGAATSTNSISDPYFMQPNAYYGFRLAVQLKSANEVITISNCVLSDKSTSFNADGVTEETLTFISYVEPVIDTVAYITATAATAI